MIRDILVTIDDQHLEKINQISRRLEDLGMAVIDVLSFSGVITGRVDSKNLDHLRKVEGVHSVDEDQEMTAR